MGVIEGHVARLDEDEVGLLSSVEGSLGEENELSRLGVVDDRRTAEGEEEVDE